MPLKAAAAFALPLKDLAEETVWSDAEKSAEIRTLPENVRSILRFAFTEMVNNAIDHSAGTTAWVRVFSFDGSIAFDVEDDGIGIFEHVMESRGLRTPFEAVAELQKGKVTTAPRLHTGQGIFFSSKIADKMTLESGATRWTIDTIRDDQSVESASKRRGTRVYFQVSKRSGRTTEEVFNRYSSADRGFTRSRTAVKLFRESGQIVSRSEAKRLLAGLEKFDEIELDFKELRGIGQGFADEVFRVWQGQHPNVRFIVLNANKEVQFMIRRTRATAARDAQATMLQPAPAALQTTLGLPSVSVGTAPSVTSSGGATFTFASSGQGHAEARVNAKEDESDEGDEGGR
jgi:anti-sigma regulatory factor (Ser/Thr protein kinase)